MKLEDMVACTFRHFKGTDYKVFGFCILNQELHILYAEASLFDRVKLNKARHSESLNWYKLSPDQDKKDYYIAQDATMENMLTGVIEKPIWIRPATSFLQVLENGIPRFKHIEY